MSGKKLTAAAKMISAFKRLVGNQSEGKNDISSFSVPSKNGMQPMNSSLQRKFARGVQYNSRSPSEWLIHVICQAIYLIIVCYALFYSENHSERRSKCGQDEPVRAITR